MGPVPVNDSRIMPRGDELRTPFASPVKKRSQFEITIAGNLKDMFMSIEMIGNDLKWRSATASPTIKIAEMMIAGE